MVFSGSRRPCILRTSGHLRQNDFWVALVNSFKITAISQAGCAVLLPRPPIPLTSQGDQQKDTDSCTTSWSRASCAVYCAYDAGHQAAEQPGHCGSARADAAVYLGGATCEGIFLNRRLSGLRAHRSGGSRLHRRRQHASGVRPHHVSGDEADIVTVLIKNCLWFWNDYLLRACF